MAHGGVGFARSLVRLGLVDEYRLLIHPVALGSGLGLFSSLARPIWASPPSAVSCRLPSAPLISRIKFVPRERPPR